MGKSLIIPGADFSANAITEEINWYIDEATVHTDLLNMNFAIRNYYSTQNIFDSVKGKTIECIRVPKNTGAGVISLGVFPLILNEVTEPVAEFEINIPFSETPQTIMLSQPIYVNDNQCLLIKAYPNNITGKPLLYGSGSTLPGSSFYEYSVNTEYKIHHE